MKSFSKISVTLSFAVLADSTCIQHSQDLNQIGKQAKSSIGDYEYTNQILSFEHNYSNKPANYTRLKFVDFGVYNPLPFFYKKRLGVFYFSFVNKLSNPTHSQV